MSNRTRAQRAQKTISLQYHNGDSSKGYPSKFVPEDVTDILTDIRHLCDAKGYSFTDLDRMAYQHYIAEFAEARKGKK